MPGRIRVFRGMTSDGKPEQNAIFTDGLRHPYGIAFYPAGAESCSGSISATRTKCFGFHIKMAI